MLKINFWENLKYMLLALPNWIGHNLHNMYGIYKVFFIMWLRPLPGGLIAIDHPLVTGVDPATGQSIWPKNLLFRSERKRPFNEEDLDILSKLMDYLAGMVRHSASTPNHPKGRPSRMPPAVNYIHATVHYNGASMLFDDCQDALAHFTDPDFRREVWRFFWREKRELTIIFRDRHIERKDFAIFSCYMKTQFPFFGNPNSNKGRIHWGTPSPYNAFNMITGWWITPTLKLRNSADHASLVRPPLNPQNYFQQAMAYNKGRTHYLWPEMFWCWFTDFRINIRGERGGVYFTDKRKLDQGFRYDPYNLISLRDRLIEKFFGGRKSL